MTPVELDPVEGMTPVIYAKDQPGYKPLPALRTPDGIVVTEWEPTADELQRLLTGQRIRLWIWTFGKPLQPVKLEVTDSCPMEP